MTDPTHTAGPMDTDAADVERSVLAQIFAEFALFVEPARAAADPWRRNQLLRALGWDLGPLIGYDSQAFQEWADGIGKAVTDMAELAAELPRDSLKAWKAAFQKLGEAAGPLKALPPEIGGEVPDELYTAMLGDLLDYLPTAYLARRARWTLPAAVLLGVATLAGDQENPSAPMPPGDNPVRLPRRRADFDLGRLIDLLSDPGGYFRALYVPEGMDTPEAVDTAAARILPKAAALLRGLGLDAAYGVKPGVGPDLGADGERLAGHLLSVRARVPDGAGDEVELGANFGLGLIEGRPALIVVPRIAAHVVGRAGGWNVSADMDLSAEAFAFGPGGVTVAGADPAVRVAAEVARISAPDEPAWVVGVPDGVHLAVGELGLALRAALGAGRDDIEIGVRAGRAEVVIAGGDGDGFVKQVLPHEKVTVPFELGVAWSHRSGLHLTGAAGLIAEFPVHATVLGVSPEMVRIGVEASLADEAVTAWATTTLSVRVGSLTAVIEDVGIAADLTFPDEGGNLGKANIAPRFKPPSGLGLHLVLGVVDGGGYLSIDEPRGMYSGAFQFGMASSVAPGSSGFRLQAVAVLNTKTADGKPFTERDGSESYSLLVSGSFQWRPGLVLPAGITLTGLGAIVGLNRRANLEELRNATRSRSLDAVLFPADPVGNAPNVIATLGRMFPPDPTGTLVGIMARLEWLAGTVRADLGIIIEFPEPIRLVVLGRLVINFQEAGRFQLDVVGTLDPGAGEVSLDGSLVDSKLFGRPASGDMALRLRWKGEKNFAVSIGGFHPAFQKPAGFPDLKRFSINLNKSGDLLRLEAYLAVTSNSVQFGGAVYLHFALSKLVVDGRAWLDALIQFKPFWLTAELGVTLSVKWGDTTFLAITALIGISGPGPWRLHGELTIHLLFLDVSKRIDKVLGDPTEENRPTFVNAADLLLDALKQPGTWDVTTPDGGGEMAALSTPELPAGQVLMHPGAVLGVRQNLLPLGVDLDRLGTSRVEGPRRFDITSFTIGGEAGTLGDTIDDYYAPGQFFDLTQAEMVERPQSERRPAGRRLVAPAGTDLPGAALTVFTTAGDDASYDRIIIDDPDTAARPMEDAHRAARDASARNGDGGGDGGLLALFAGNGPAANARTRTTGPARFAARPLAARIDHSTDHSEVS
ncbi:DUF6603 domain-containing protein [Actinomadura fibrosa]|uniref:DUF6603 domain-containing protein n=1 Tax=Actinomadura fibrosa TaxID=111802 RepID=A0ABW2XQG1_9ACTN|nr:DUF6603 domain-containing protein [Actinomadura fibrosa]